MLSRAAVASLPMRPCRDSHSKPLQVALVFSQTQLSSTVTNLLEVCVGSVLSQGTEPCRGGSLLVRNRALSGMFVPAPTAAQQVLDRVEIVETPTAAEIHIAFNTRIIYQRHTPSD